MIQAKKLIEAIIAGGIGLVLFYLAMTLGRNAGASPWLTGVVTVTIVFLLAAGFRFREHDNNDRIRGLLLVIGLVSLSAAGIANEYVKHFFIPSFFYVVMALLPGLVFAVYRAFLEMRSNESTDVNDQDGGKN